MERSIANIYKTRNPTESLVKIQSQTRKSEKFKTMIEKVLDFIPLENMKFLTSLLLISKRHIRFLSKCIYQKMLLELTSIPKNIRIKLYRKLIILDAESFYDSVRFSRNQKSLPNLENSSNHLQTIQKDVFRTKFFKGDSKELEKLLVELAEFVPSMGYFQGLNCIAAYMLDYTGDYLACYDILSFLMHKQMKKYFMGDFQLLNKLIFIGEKLIMDYYPIIYDMLSQSDIGHDFYMSGIIVTIYFNTLQFSKNYFLLINSLDLFFSEGWIGFYKVFL
jgi:hypothetical protein